MPRNPIVSKLFEIIDPVLSDAGYELVDLEFRREQHGWVLRVFVDTADQPGGISFDDCTRITRELSPILDVEDPIPQAYSLEVSSPGIARPLRTPAHFRQHLGSVAKVALAKGIDGRRNFTGELISVEQDNTTVVINVDGKEFRLPLDDLDNAKLVPDWDAALRN